MNFEDYSKSSAKKKREYLEFSNAKKNIAESEKNIVEAKEVENPFYKKPNFYIVLISALIPSILGIIAFYGTSASKFFDNKVIEVKLEKRELQIEKKDLQRAIDSLSNIKAIIANRSLILEKKYDGEMKKFDSIKDDISKKHHVEKKRLIKEQEVLSSKLSLKNRSYNELSKDLTDALRALKQKNETIFQLNDALDKSGIAYDINDVKRTLLMKNIFIYMLHLKRFSVSIDELRKNVDRSISKRFIREIIDEYDPSWSHYELTDSGKSKNTVFTIRNNIKTEDLIDFYFTD